MGKNVVSLVVKVFFECCVVVCYVYYGNVRELAAGRELVEQLIG